MQETWVQCLGQVGKIPWRRKWQPTPVLLPGKCHGQGSLVSYSPWGHKELDMTQWLNRHLQTCRIPPYFRHQTQAQVITYASQQVIDRRFQQSPPTQAANLNTKYFWPPGYKSEGSMTSSSGSINLLEWLTELRERFCSLGYWFIIKGYSSGTARWKRYEGQGTWEGFRASMSSQRCTTLPSTCVHQVEAFWTLSFGFSWKIHYIGMTD